MQKLNKGDKVAIVSLSRGLLGMPFCKHELDLGIQRLKEFGLVPVIMPNSLKDMDYLENHPEDRASDLKAAFKDKDIKAIICAIGGNDTYKIIPYLMEDDEFVNLVKNNKKIFTGFSDSTVNHLMLNRLGLSTFYGPCFLVDLAELDKEMLPYTREYFLKYFSNEESFYIKSSPIWYKDRTSYSQEQIGIPREKENELHGYEVLNGHGLISGKLYGGCIESIYDLYTDKDQNGIAEKYNILPSLNEYKEKILFLETSDEKISPDKFKEILLFFKTKKILQSVKGILIGKPIDEVYYDEYKEVIKEIFKDIDTPVMYNINFGHSVPRCILPYDKEAIVNYDEKTIKINERILE